MKKAVMYGAGNIGRGFIGQLFSESGYEVVFIDVNAAIIDRLNEDGAYPVRILNGQDIKDVIVKNVRGVNGTDYQCVTEEIAGADVMATAVGVNVLPRIAGPIAEGLKKRWRQGRMDPLNIIICENLLDADRYLAGLIMQELDDAEKNRFEKLVGLVEASIGRMVPVMTPEMQEGNILRICVEEYAELPVDKDGFKGEIPTISNMLPSRPFAFYIQRKLFIHNLGHVIAAYLGSLKGYAFIWQSIADPFIRLAVLRAMQDSAKALSKEHGIPLHIILDHVDDLIYRFGNKLLGDTVARVGNDVSRKLSPNDRLVGAANLCLNHGINPAGMCLGIAAAMKFNGFGNGNKGVNDILTKEGPEAVLKKICGISEDSMLFDCVLQLYSMIGNASSPDEVMEAAELMRRKAG